MVSLFSRRKKPRVVVLGLDCAGPQLVFDAFKADLPVMSKLASEGTWGRLESCIPCITVPAWASMLSSRDPGVIGVYGFRNRPDHSYRKMTTADGAAIKVKRVWDYVGEAGKQSMVMGVPQTYPVRPLNGHLISDFLTPNSESAFTYPAILKSEVLNLAPNYPFDVKDFRTEDKSGLLQRIYDLTETQFKVAQHNMKTKPWDFFMWVNMGTDRIHHGFWRYYDPQHRLYEPGNALETAIRDYYRAVDGMIGKLIELIDDAVLLIVSDHGVTRMDGGICINEWLWRSGWLALKNTPTEGQIVAFDESNVDWERTKAWASGGYYGRVFLNVQGREPQGVIPADAYEAVCDELAAAIRAIPDDKGQALKTQVFKPKDIYSQVGNIAPDLIVYFGDLHWRSVGSLGHGKHFTLENDTGPDDANHDTHGMFILHDGKGRGRVEGHQLMDIAPTLLNRMGLTIPAEMQGKIIG
ncbi:MAG: alkaline phosphatase family protein [Anaerolineae bacterium]